MRRLRPFGAAGLCALSLTVLSLLPAHLHGSQAAAPVVHIFVFLSPDCPTCKPVEAEALAKTGAEIGCDVKPRYFDVEDIANYRILLAFERRLNDAENDLPVVVIGDEILGGVEEIERHLRGLLAGGADAGGVSAPEMPDGAEIEQAARMPAVSGTVHAVFFDSPGCRECGRAEHILNYYREGLGRLPGGAPRLQIARKIDTSRETKLWQEILCERAGVPEGDRLVVPAVFIGEDALVASAITDSAVAGLLGRHRRGAPPPEAPSEEEMENAVARLNRRFRNIGFATVLLGGLVDGINPCAFVTLIFLVGYLAATGRRGTDIILVGSGFSAAVFCAYFAVGAGLVGALEGLRSLPVVSKALTWFLIAGTFVLALLSGWDAVRALRGRTREMKLRLPSALRKRLSLTVARQFRTRTVLLAAVVTGLTVSLIELVCTGQIYLPLIRLMISFSASRSRALAFLAAYNAAFVTPLVVTFLAVFAGLSSRRLTGIFERHLALSKVLATCVFITLGIMLIIIG